MASVEYVYNLKALSVLSVLLIHSIADYFYLFKSTSQEVWLSVTIIDSFVRFCVPVFLVCSGMTILNKDYSISRWFLSKIFLRLTLPFVFYSFISALIDFKDIGLIIRNLTLIRYYLPFYTVVLSLYLIYPIIRSWLKNTSIKIQIYFLVLWLITVFINFFKPGFRYISDQLLYGYLGFPVFGYFITKINTKKFKNIGLLLYLISCISLAFITIFTSYKSGILTERFFDYMCPLVVLMTIGISVYIKNVKFKFNKKITLVRNFLSDHSWGMYLMHPIIIKLIHPYTIGYRVDVSIILTFSYTLILTGSLLFLLKKIPLVRNFIG